MRDPSFTYFSKRKNTCFLLRIFSCCLLLCILLPAPIGDRRIFGGGRIYDKGLQNPTSPRVMISGPDCGPSPPEGHSLRSRLCQRTWANAGTIPYGLGVGPRTTDPDHICPPHRRTVARARWEFWVGAPCESGLPMAYDDPVCDMALKEETVNRRKRPTSGKS